MDQLVVDRGVFFLEDGKEVDYPRRREVGKVRGSSNVHATLKDVDESLGLSESMCAPRICAPFCVYLSRFTRCFLWVFPVATRAGATCGVVPG